MKLVKTNVPGFEKDLESQVVVGSDDAYENYMKQKKSRMREKKLEQEVQSLQSKLNRLEELLLKVLEKND